MNDQARPSDAKKLFIPGAGGSMWDQGTEVDVSGEDSRPGSWSSVPWRTIVATVAIVAATFFLVLFIQATARILTWIAIAGLFAIVLEPLVRRVQHRLGGRRSLATGVVVFSALFIIIGIVVLFVMPVRRQLVEILTDLPGTVRQAANGRGPLGEIVTKLRIESYVKDREPELTEAAQRLGDSSFQAAQVIVNSLVAFVTVTLMTFLFISQSVAIGQAVQNVVPLRRRGAVQRTAKDAAGAVSGYVTGNLLISLIAGVAAFVCLFALGVSSPVVLALWVAFADLIPLIGATLGAAICVLAAFLHSPKAGIVALIFFVIYQQLENGVIYPWMMAKRLQVNPLGILLSVLLASELYGILGALLAVPVSGALQAIVISLRQERRRERLVLPPSVDLAPLDSPS